MSDPQTKASEARMEALQAVEEAADMDSVAEQAKAEQEAVEAFAQGMAEALIAGFSEADTGPYASAIADASAFYNKSDVKGKIQECVEEAAGADRMTFDEAIRERLDSVDILRTTDKSNPQTTYSWKFQECTVETHAGRDGRGHREWSNFRDLYYEAGGENTARPQKALRSGEEWRDFITAIEDERGTVIETRGPRTVAVESLQNKIRANTAYSDLGTAVERDGIYVDVPTVDLPEWWGSALGVLTPDAPPVRETDRDVPPTVREVWVPNRLVNRVVEAEGISHTALQSELHRRGHTLSRLTGRVSESRQLNGTSCTFWALDPGEGDFTPRTYVPVGAEARGEGEETDGGETGPTARQGARSGRGAATAATDGGETETEAEDDETSGPRTYDSVGDM